MLNIKGDKVQSELGGSLLFGVLENELEVSGLVLSHQGDAVAGVGELHNFGKKCNIQTKNHGGVSAVMLEALHAEVEGNKCDVRSIHSLE
mgnify:CR=1 FL=1